MAETVLERLRRDRPDLFRSESRAGFLRGIDAYGPERFERVFARAVAAFTAAHGRAPDLVGLPSAADHFFRMKFFDFVPTCPIPSSKLQCADYVPAHLRRRIRIPARPWISREPLLPADAHVPPGIYWLKLEFGNGRHVRLPWPPSPGVRQTAQQVLSEQFPVKTWAGQGEWWYALGPQRAFLEQDLQPLLADGCEMKIFVRRGAIAVGYTVRYGRGAEQGSKWISFFDGAGRSMPGTLRLAGTPDTYGQMALLPPRDFEGLLAAVAEVGRPFDLIRVDLLVAASGEAYLGELSLCVGNARVVFEPPGFDADVTQRLFGPLPGQGAAP